MTSITVYGASDDLIEIDGDIIEEFSSWHPDADECDYIAVSDGTILRVKVDANGVWRIQVVVRGTADVTVEQAPGGDEDNYTDRATIVGDVKWVALATAYATASKGA